ncbi:hypothetical protein GA0070624_5202 [Micromonospora rhizosphaerae]|uniref:Uncharacterized protein n=1 Tax=Micromonospora rhizosphaerae TaxID=568872 RepID=A0A1C6T1K3_9ACTN|nr:hypothetical protein [Micromonospora rhizosphaerae]SCL35225.1 hypothetical protein GA0070624_5202 [Micromonospora rhizosphaerae]
MERPDAASTFTPVLRLLLGLLGAGSFGAGTTAVFLTENGTGSAVMLAFGGVLLVLALLGNRIESLEFGGAQLKLRAAAAEKFALAEESEQLGNDALAQQLRTEAHSLLDAAAGPVAANYRSVRNSMRAGPDRTRAMEAVVTQARRLATTHSFEPDQVRHWLREGTDEERITALAMMQAEPALRDFDAMLSAIADSRSAFEQYHALRLAVEMIDGLEEVQRIRLAQTVRDARGIRFRQGTDRWQLSEKILHRLG